MITALKLNFSEYKELTFELRRFYYLNWIAGKTVNTIKQTSFNLIKFIKEGQSLSFIREELNKKLEADNIFQLALSNLKSNSAKTSWIKPVLMMIEYKQTDNEDKDFVPLSRKVHLEHILPVQYKKFSEWNHIEEETAENYLNSIGNLTLLGGSKNVEASNLPFEAKLNIYKGKGKSNNKKKGITNFLITQKIAQDMYEGNLEKWDKNAMENRWNWFLNELKDLLQINVSPILINEKNKIEDIKIKTLIKSEKKIHKIIDKTNNPIKESGQLFESGEKETKKQEKKRKNKEFFNQFLDEMKEEHPDFYLRRSVNNAIKAVPSKSFSHITVYRSVENHHCIGVFWLVKKEKDRKLFELMKADSEFPKDFKIHEPNRAIKWTDNKTVNQKARDWRAKFRDAPDLSTILNFNDIYDPSTYLKQKEFLKTNLVSIYNYMKQKFSELEKNLNPKAS